jgi:hypothetical protein
MKFGENPFGESPCGKTDMTTVEVTFRNCFVKANITRLLTNYSDYSLWGVIWWRDTDISEKRTAYIVRDGTRACKYRQHVPPILWYLFTKLHGVSYENKVPSAPTTETT